MFFARTPAGSLRVRRALAQRPRWHRLAALFRSRRALAQLTPTQLHDVGLSQMEAQQEAARPLWDVPCNWRD